MKRPCIVIFYADDSVHSVFGWDDHCDGAICHSLTPTVFPTREAARRAIRISRSYALLCLSQGKPVNTDFTEDLKYIRIVDVVVAEKRDA